MVSTTANPVRTAAHIAEVDAAVRAVLALDGRRALTPAGRARSAEVEHAGRLFALRHAEALPATARAVRLAPGTVVTPLASDLLRKREIAVLRGGGEDGRAASRGGAWGFAVADGADSGLVAALRRGLLEEAWTELEPSASAAAHWVAEVPSRGALLVTEEAARAVWQACQTAGVRAANVGSPEALIRAVRSLGVNLLVVEPLGMSISWLRQLSSTFRRAGAPVRPAGLIDEDGKEACRCGSPR